METSVVSAVDSRVVPHVSLSRARLLTTCQEQDRLRTQGVAGWWLADAAPRARLLHRLKQVTTLDAALGSGVHAAAAALARAVRDGHTPPGYDALQAIVRGRLNEAAQRDVAAWLRRPARPIYREALFGEWPDGRVPAAEAERVLTRAGALLRRLLGSAVVGELAACGRGDVVVADTLEGWYVDVDGEPVKVYAAPDLVYRLGARLELPGLPVPVPAGTVCLVDWKTGAGGRGGDLIERTRLDLLTYAVMVRDRLGLPPGPLGYLARCAHLGAAAAAEADTAWLLGPADLAAGRATLERAVRDLRARSGPDGVIRHAARSLDACRWCPYACACAEPDRLPPAVAAWLAEGAPDELGTRGAAGATARPTPHPRAATGRGGAS